MKIYLNISALKKRGGPRICFEEVITGAVQMQNGGPGTSAGEQASNKHDSKKTRGDEDDGTDDEDETNEDSKGKRGGNKYRISERRDFGNLEKYDGSKPEDWEDLSLDVNTFVKRRKGVQQF